MPKPIDSTSIEDIIDRVAENPKFATDAKRALRKMVIAKEPANDFSYRPRRTVAEIDDDLFDNMPV